jgi:hypothetical protein
VFEESQYRSMTLSTITFILSYHSGIPEIGFVKHQVSESMPVVFSLVFYTSEKSLVVCPIESPSSCSIDLYMLQRG